MVGGGLVANAFTPEEFNAIATTLQAAHIVVGHSIVPDISTDYGGKLIRLDIHHAEDKPEALLINNGQVGVVDASGKWTMLFDGL